MTEAGAYPVCYRHPNRETYVSCSRCNRPICPDCMTPASVGMHCPECVREARRSVRQPRRRLMAGGFLARPDWLTVAIIAINVAVFLLQQVDSSIERRFAMFPFGIAHNHEWYRLITAAFLHANVIHILFNMYALYLVGPQLEVALGRTRYGVLYVVSALGGSTLSYYFGPVVAIGIGASGAVFGCFGALAVIGRRMNVDIRPLVGLIVINLLIGFLPHIDWRAHVGGLVTGVVLATAYVYPPRKTRLMAGSLATVAVAVAIVLTVIARTHQLT